MCRLWHRNVTLDSTASPIPIVTWETGCRLAGTVLAQIILPDAACNYPLCSSKLWKAG